MGYARIYDFNGKRGTVINPDAYQILDLLDQRFSILECIDILAKTYHIDKKSLEPTIENILRTFKQIGLVTLSSAKPGTGKPVIPPLLKLDYSHTLNEAVFELTSQCNLTCKHCYGSFGPGCSQSLSKETVFSLLDQLKELQCPEVRFTGGEPFLHKDFLEILEYAHQYNFIILIVTNGTLITPGIAARIKKMGQMDINISIDGHTPEINDTFRGVPGTFERAVRAIKLLTAAGFKVRINHSLHKANRAFANEMWDLADQLGVPMAVGQVYRYGNCRENADDIYITPGEYYDTVKKIRHRFPHENNGNGKWPEAVKKTNGFIHRCDGGRTKMAIRPNGDVTPCITFPHIDKFVMGNIHKTGIKEIFYGFDREKMLGDNNALRIGKCKNCRHVMECKSGCLAIAYAETGTLKQPDPFSCAREKAIRGYPDGPKEEL